MIYLIPFVGAIVSSLLYFINQKRVSNFLILIVGVILILIAGFRYDTGFDYWNYKLMYHLAKTTDFDKIKGSEPLFGVILKMFTSLSFDYCIFFIALVSISLKIIATFRFSTIPAITILIYVAKLFVLADMGQIRQGLAMGILMFSLPYILNRNLIKFMLLVILASLIHSTSILFVLAYFLANLKLNTYSYLFIFFLSFIFIFINITAILNKLVFIMPSLVAQKFLFYSQVHKVGVEYYYKTVLLKIPVFLISLLYFDKIKNNKLHLLLFNIYFFGVILSLVFISFYQLCIRGSLYFTQFEILLIPLFIYYLRPRVINIIAYFLIITYSTFSFSKIYFSDWSKYLIPYISVFEKEKVAYKRSQAEFQ